MKWPQLVLLLFVLLLLSATAAPPRWQELFPSTNPPARATHAMAYDTARGVAVLFGGVSSQGSLADTWEWHSATMTWTEPEPAHRPSPRYGHAMVYDEARGVTMLFGGETDPDTAETWLWDGNDWTQLFPTNSPSQRWAHSMVYDSQRQMVVLFGGLEDQVPLGDTWEWDGTNWVEQPIPGPYVRSGALTAYDARRNVTVLFGGTTYGINLNDTWERVGSGPWQEMAPPQSPPSRERGAAAFFPRLRRVTIFGGVDGYVYRDDTDIWDGQVWRKRPFDPRPAGRCCFGMVYDPVLRGILLFGGSVSFVHANDTWIFR